MKNAADVDLLIIGQGLAGSAVAMRALAKNYRIMVLDQPAKNRSSTAAAGLFNPITGRKMVKTWLADELFPCLHQFYPEVERVTSSRFFYPMPIYRPFFSIEEQNEWMGKSTDTLFKNFTPRVSLTPQFGEKISDPFGGLTLSQSGYIDTRAYLSAVRDYLLARSSFQVATFDDRDLEIGVDGLRYGKLRARKVIFCQGVGNLSNRWFGMLPVKSLKGEYLTIQSQWVNDVILNRGIYMVPGPDLGAWRVGATYNWNDATAAISDWARAELTQKLNAVFRIPYTITGQQWGFRPTTSDRKPIIGVHPDHPSLIIFNGLGTKGVSLAPYFSEVLFRLLENKGTIEREADVTRFI